MEGMEDIGKNRGNITASMMPRGWPTSFFLSLVELQIYKAIYFEHVMTSLCTLEMNIHTGLKF